MTCGAVLCFTVIDTSGKLLTPSVGVGPSTWLRFAAATIILLPFLNPWTSPGFHRSDMLGLQILRATLLFGSTLGNFIAMQYLQLAQTVTIGFTAPLLFALLAGPFLGEWAGPRRLAAIVVGFCGVLIVTRPGLSSFHPAFLVSFLAALCYASVLLLTRNLSRRDSAETTFFYSTIGGVFLAAPLAFWDWKSPASPTDWLLVCTAGLGAAVGHWLMISAQRRAPAPVLAPFIYTQIIWMPLSGYIFFGDVPDVWTFVGGAIIVSSGLYILHRERVRRAAPRPIE